MDAATSTMSKPFDNKHSRNTKEMKGSTVFWADMCAEMEKAFMSRPGHTDLTLPWNGNNNKTRGLGSQPMWLWMKLKLDHLDGVVELKTADKIDDTNFLGIESITVNDLERFNSGLFPLPSYWTEKHARSSGRCHFTLKTLVHNWRAIGMVQVRKTNHMVFKAKARQSIRGQRARADIHKRTKSGKTVVQSVTTHAIVKPAVPPAGAKQQDQPPVANAVAAEPMAQLPFVAEPTVLAQLPFTTLPSPFTTASVTFTTISMITTTPDAPVTLAPIHHTTEAQRLILPSLGALELLSHIASQQAAVRADAAA
jgi:hypothetical protein